MEDNRSQVLAARCKELQRELSLIQAQRDTEHDLSEELKHHLWVEAKQVDELVNRLLGGHHGKK